MNLDRAVEHAHAVRGPKSAARLHNDISQELEHGLYDEDQEAEAKRAHAILEQRYPGVRDAASEITDPPNLSPAAKRNLDGPPPERHSARRRRSSTSTPRSRGGRGGSSRREGGSSSGVPRIGQGTRSPAARTAARVVDRATGGAASSISDNVITGLGFLLAAGIGYQLLQTRGSNAFSTILGTVGRGVHDFVAPVDPFTPRATSASASSASGPSLVGAANPSVTRRMVQHPLTPFPNLHLKSPLLATGPAASHVKVPTSPLSIGG